jgi:hypothetical protein
MRAKLYPLFLLFTFSFFLSPCAAQDPESFQITPPKLDFDGRQLSISYDFVNSRQSDKFYVWVEMEKKNGEQIKPKSISGDIGGKIKAGEKKLITWVPGNDSVFLNEMVSVEVKAEKYVKSFHKGSMMLLSTVIPGLGQTKISNGKPFWLTAVAAYGALGGGFIVHNNYSTTYKSYLGEEDPSKRANLLTKAQNQLNTSNVLIISGAALWVANIFWVAVTPDRYKPLQHMQLSLDQSTGPFKGPGLLSLRFKF